MRALGQPKTRAWNDIEWRDRHVHIVSDDEHAAGMLAEALSGIDPRHSFALCGVSLVCFERNPTPDAPRPSGPECVAINWEQDRHASTCPSDCVPGRARQPKFRRPVA